MVQGAKCFKGSFSPRLEVIEHRWFTIRRFSLYPLFAGIIQEMRMASFEYVKYRYQAEAICNH